MDLDSPNVLDPMIRQGLRVPMRDGVTLALDLITPNVNSPLPVILIRTPYDKVQYYKVWDRDFVLSLAGRGYAVAVQDVRGRFNSDGAFFPYAYEREDGYDTVEWLASQPWCDGNVGMYGASYAGRTQCSAAAAHPPHLRAIVPICSTPPELFFNFPILNGVFVLPMAEWATTLGLHSYQDVGDLRDLLFNRERPYYTALPLASMLDAAGTSLEWWDEMMRHPNLDGFWRDMSYENAFTSGVPTLSISGWYDMSLSGAPSLFHGMTSSDGANPSDHRLVIGPWPHDPLNTSRVLNGVDFGAGAVIDLTGYIMRFLDRYLKGKDNGLESEPRVQVFVMGANEWSNSDDWPLPGTEYLPMYLHSGGQANTLHGDGMLSAEPPAAEPPDRFSHNPLDPVGSVWSMRDGPVDETNPSARSDVLCYTSNVLTEPLDVVGPVTCKLFASTSARDADWHVRLVDIWPDGTPRFLCHGVLRARFRKSFVEPSLPQPNEICSLEIALDPIGVRFLPGHRIGIEISSSWFPRFERNTGSGAPNNFLDDSVVTAEHRVFHDDDRPSTLVLPVVGGALRVA